MKNISSQKLTDRGANTPKTIQTSSISQHSNISPTLSTTGGVAPTFNQNNWVQNKAGNNSSTFSNNIQTQPQHPTMSNYPIIQREEEDEDDDEQNENTPAKKQPKSDKPWANSLKEAKNIVAKAKEKKQQEDSNWGLKTSGFLPAGYRKTEDGLGSLYFLQQNAKTQAKTMKTLESSSELREQASSTSGQKVEPIEIDENLGYIRGATLPIPETVEEEAVITEETTNQDQVEMLAQEVYKILRQKITIDKERYGNHYY